MPAKPIERRTLLKMSTLAAAAASAAPTTIARAAENPGILGYDLPNEPFSIDDVEQFLELGRYAYDWSGKTSPYFPNGSREAGDVVVTPRDDGPGLTYVLDAMMNHQDESGTRVTRDDRLSVTQIFPTIDGHTGVTVHTSFGVYQLGHVIEMTDDTMVIQTLGVSEAFGAPVHARFAFRRSPDGYIVILSARQDAQSEWQVFGESTWNRSA